MVWGRLNWSGESDDDIKRGDSASRHPCGYQAAAARLEGQAPPPVMTSRSFNADAGVATWFKCEQFQRRSPQVSRRV